MHDWVGVPPPSKQQMEELTESERKSQGLHPSKMAREELLAWLYAPIARTEFDSIEAARAWAAADPYAQAGVFSEVLVQPFVKVFPR